MMKAYPALPFILSFQVILFGSTAILLRQNSPQVKPPYSVSKENEANFRAIGATPEFAKYVWRETVRAFPVADRLKMPKIHFTDRSTKEFGYSGYENVFGFYDSDSDVIVIFPKTHISTLGVDFSIERNDPTKTVSSMGRKDAQAAIGITLIHEFRHYIFCSTKSVRPTRQHLDMVADEEMYSLMRRVSEKLTSYTDTFLAKERSILQQSVERDNKREFDEYVRSGQR